MPTPITLNPATLPEGTCFPGNMQDLLNLVVNNVLASLDDTVTLFNFGPNVPPVDRQDQPWIRTDAFGKFLGVYTFTNGAWAPADPPFKTGDMMPFYGDAGLIVAPWWNCNGQIVTVNGVAYPTPDMRGCVPIGAGLRTLPTDSTDTATNFVMGTAYGRETLILTPQNLPAHAHGLMALGAGGGSGPSERTPSVNGAATEFDGLITGGNTTGEATDGTPNPPQAASILPPGIAVNYKMFILGSDATGTTSAPEST